MECRKGVSLLLGFAWWALHATMATAQQRQPPLVGTVAPGAVGSPAPTAAPIGGLHTTPLSAPSSRAAAGSPAAIRNHWPLFVEDAPRIVGGVAVAHSSEPSPTPIFAAREWMPTAERPRWIVDTGVTAVQAWRDLIVTDAVCHVSGRCVERRQRVRARWVAPCRCYAFADALGRVWRVE